MNANDRPVEPSGPDRRFSRSGFLAGAAAVTALAPPGVRVRPGFPVTVVSSPGRRAGLEVRRESCNDRGPFS
jgi:hypothetical protein